MDNENWRFFADSKIGLFELARNFYHAGGFYNLVNQNSLSFQVPGAIVLSVPATVETCLDHGVFRMNDDGTLQDIVYQGSQAELDRFLDEDRAKSKMNYDIDK